MFHIEVEKYHQKDLRVVPVAGKNCPVKDWASVDFYEIKDQYSKSGVGLSLGDCDLVVLDIDSLNEDEKKEYDNFLKDYPTPIMRVGNPNKLPSRFYAKTWQAGKIKSGVLELLNANKGQASVCVLPPTPHPDFKGKQFRWVNENNLLNFDLSLLPALPKDAWNGLLKIKEKYSDKKTPEITKGHGRCNHGSYDYLSKIMVGHVRDGEGVDYIVDILLKKDAEINSDISFFNCPSRKEWRSNDKKTNCEQFVLECMKNQVKKNAVQRVEIGESITIEPPRSEKNYRKLPRLEGFAKVIFDDLYNNSPIPRSQLCFMNAINLISILVGNKLFHKGTSGNLYQYGIAPSGYGKDFSFKRSKQLLEAAGLEKLIGSQVPSSQSAVLMEMEKQSREICYFVNEAEVLLKKLNDVRMNHGLRECLTDLYDYGGRHHTPKKTINAHKKDKELDSFGDIFSPFINILMTSTTEAFTSNAGNDIFETGFGSRFLFFFEDRFKRQKLIENYNPKVSEDLKKGLTLFRQIGYCDLYSAKDKFEINNAEITDAGKKIYNEIFKQVEDEKEKEKSNRFFPIISRKMYFIHKLTLNHHCSIHPVDYVTAPLDACSYAWAKEAVDVIVHNMIQNLDQNVSRTNYGKLQNEILRYITKRTHEKKPTTKGDIARRFRDYPKNVRQAAIDDLIEQSNVFQSSNKELHSMLQVAKATS
jgi:hypothetical protein